LLRFREAGVEVVLKVVTNKFYCEFIKYDNFFLSYLSYDLQDFRKRWDRQSQAFYNLFRQADRIDKLAEVIQRLVFPDFQKYNSKLT